MVNKRPVALIETTRDNSVEAPQTITPEMLIHGYSLPSVNCVPGLHPVPDDPLWECNPALKIKDTYKQLRKVRTNMLDIYKGEFLSNLISQATDDSSRYKPKRHSTVDIGDIVCIKEKYSKPNNYPLAVVLEVTKNDFGEITDLKLKRGDNGEIVRRHTKVIIPLLQLKLPRSDEVIRHNASTDTNHGKLYKRQASIEARRKISNQLNNS